MNRWQRETFCRKTRPEKKNRVSILAFGTLCVNITKTFLERRFMTFGWLHDDSHAYVKDGVTLCCL